MKLRVVLVEPEYQQNVGYCARTVANFGVNDLRIVKGVKLGTEAVKYSKHAVGLLKKAKKVKTVKAAVSGSSIVIGTTALHDEGRDVLRNAVTPKQAAKRLAKTDAKVTLLIGREGTGLTKEELELCDIIVRIPTSKDYGTLNISHALAIILYEFQSVSEKKEKEIEYLNPSERTVIKQQIKRLLSHMKGIHSPRTTSLSVNRIIYRGIRSRVEGRALLNFLKKLK